MIKSKNKRNTNRVSVILRRPVQDKNQKQGMFNYSHNDDIIYTTYGMNRKFPIISSFLVGIRAIMDRSELCFFYTVGAALPFCILNNFIFNRKKCIINAFILDEKWKKVKPILKWVLQGADKFVVFSKGEMKYYISNFALDKQKLTWMPLGVQATFDKKSQKPNLGNYVFAGGNSHRDYFTFVRAVKTTKLKSVIACGHKYYKKLKKEEGERIEIFPWLEYSEFWRILTGAKYVVVPLSEKNISCGQLVFLGAMARGKTVVVPRVSATTDYIQDGITGFFYDYGDDCSLAEVLEYLDSRPDLVRKVGIAAQNAVLKLYNAKVFLESLEDLMVKVLSD